MKRVKMLQSIAGLRDVARGFEQDWSFRIGEEVLIPAEIAEKWVAGGICLLAGEPEQFRLSDSPRQQAKRGRKEDGNGSAD